MTVIPIAVSTHVPVTKGLIQGLEVLEIRGRVEIIQKTELLRSARLLRRVLEICFEKPSANPGVKKLLNEQNDNYILF